MIRRRVTPIHANRRGRGLILPVVLVMIGLLSLTMAGYVFFVRAETAGIRATNDAQQARLAAESGLEEIVALMRLHPQDPTVWYDNPQRLRHALIWAESYDRESDPIREARNRRNYLAEQAVRVPAWRYSAVAARLDGPEDTMRFGVTPESSRLNLNTATEQQLADLLTPLLVDLQVENPETLIASLLDWRDPSPQAREGGAKNDYYNTLEPPYNAKNGPFDTVEELLLVKGFNAAILWGEDINRNGILDENENDGGKTAPYYDNGDGILNHGIAPFLTVWSADVDRASDNRPRINLNDDVGRITLQIETYFTEGEISQDTLQAILALKSQGGDLSGYASAASLFAIPGSAEDPLDPNSAGPPAGDPNDAGPGGGGPQQPGRGQALPKITVPEEELPILLDYFSTRSGDDRVMKRGLININTAPARVLAVVPGLPQSAIPTILDLRGRLDPQKLRSIAWLRTEGVLSQSQFERVAPVITAGAYQFRVEVFAYADHSAATARMEWVLDLVGFVPQVRYYRDLTRLGPGWPVDSETVIVSRQ